MRLSIKFLMATVAALFMLLFMSGCGYSTPDGRDNQTVNSQQSIYQKNQPVPVFNFSQPRDSLIQIYKATMEARNTYSVVVSRQGTPIFSCPSVGYPIPITTQLTNPEQTAGYNGAATISQAEPNGLFTGTSSATYVQCIRKNGDVVPIYSEPDVISFPFPVRKNADGSYSEVEDAPSTIKLDVQVKKP